MLNLVTTEAIEMLDLVKDMMKVRSDYPDYFVKLDGCKQAKDFRDKLIMVLYVKLLNYMARSGEFGKDEISLEDQYGITEEEINLIRKRLANLQCGKIENDSRLQAIDEYVKSYENDVESPNGNVTIDVAIGGYNAGATLLVKQEGENET
jgi:hypothetical protein